MTFFGRRTIFGHDHESIGAEPMDELVFLVTLILPGCNGRSPAIMFVAAAPCNAVASAKADDCGLLLNPAESASPENNRQSEQNDCDRHKRRAGDVSEKDEKDRDDGEDCGEVVVHSFPIV